MAGLRHLAYIYVRFLKFLTGMQTHAPPLPWLDPGDPLPPADTAWGERSDAPGLLAAGGALDCSTLRRAYGAGIFPWFSEGQPILWWSPNPRMVLSVAQFRLHRSFRKTLMRFRDDPCCEIRIDTAFPEVMASCAYALRKGQPGTWIVPAMERAYADLFAAGDAHSVETWVNGQLVGGLYCVALGCAVFGESMFTRVPDASKIALAALVAFSRENGVALIDCQQNTQHLASLGAAEIERAAFVEHVQAAREFPKPHWQFSPLYWQHLLPA
jgi:leucyl/phenylalanyl-tRNA--protein transferase